MKTRFFTMTMAILFTAVIAAGAANSATQNSTVASGHENATEQNFTGIIPDMSSAESFMIEEWIDGRNDWEQAGPSMISDYLLNGPVLDEWIMTRDNWEQEDLTLSGDNMDGKSLLEEWILSSDNWEQK